MLSCATQTTAQYSKGLCLFYNKIITNHSLGNLTFMQAILYHMTSCGPNMVASQVTNYHEED